MTEDEVVAAISSRVGAGKGADLPDPYPESPASDGALAGAEQIIGYSLPRLLRRLYREVANGGFGPSGGVEGVGGGHAGRDGLLAGYVRWRDEGLPGGFPAWTPGVVALCDLGGEAWMLLDCRTPDGRLLVLRGSTVHRLHLTLSRWFELWLADELGPHLLVAG